MARRSRYPTAADIDRERAEILRAAGLDRGNAQDEDSEPVTPEVAGSVLLAELESLAADVRARQLATRSAELRLSALLESIGPTAEQRAALAAAVAEVVDARTAERTRKAVR